jgi:hypothetical protein
VFTSNSAVIGNGTAFTSNFSSGDEFVVIDRSASKNLLTFPDDMSNAAWGKLSINTSNTAYNDTQGPFGTWTADRIVEDTSNALHIVYQLIPITAGAFFTASTYIKSYTENRIVRLQIANAAGSNGVRAWFNPINGAVTSASTFGTGSQYVSSSMTNVGNGWYRCVLSGRIDTTSTTLNMGFYLSQVSGTTTYAGDNVSGLYIDASQLEAGNTATSYAGPFFNPNHKFTVNTITSDTLMTVRVPPSANVINSDHYVIAI